MLRQIFLFLSAVFTLCSYAQNQNIKADSNSTISYIDTSEIKNAIRNKRIIFIGESVHNCVEFNVIKRNIIEYLTNNEGFSVVLFEANMNPMYFANTYRLSLTADSILKNTLFRVWHTRENLQLFRFLKEKPQIEFMGFDMHGRNILFTTHMNKILELIDSSMAKEFVNVDTLLTSYELKYAKRAGLIPVKKLANDSSRFRKIYQECINTIYKAQYIDDREKRIMKKCLQNRIELIAYLCHSDKNSGFETRENALYENLIFLTDTIFKGEKIIVWAHNDHIDKDTSFKIRNKVQSMGARFNKTHESECFYVGLYAPLTPKFKKFFIISNLNSININPMFINLNEDKRDEYPFLYEYNVLYGGLFKTRKNLSKSFDGIIYSKSLTRSTIIK